MWISQVLSGLSTRNCTRHVMCVYFVNGIWNHGGRTTWKNWKWWILYLNANLNRLVDVPQIIKCNVFLTDVGVIFLKNVISWNDQISVHPGEMVHALVCFYGTLYFQPNFIQQIVSCHNCIRIILGSCLAIAPHVANFQFAETCTISCFFFLVTICPQRISTNNVQLTNFNQHTLGSLNLLNDMENPGFPICYLSLYIYNYNDHICFFAYKFTIFNKPPSCCWCDVTKHRFRTLPIAWISKLSFHTNLFVRRWRFGFQILNNFTKSD